MVNSFLVQLVTIEDVAAIATVVDPQPRANRVSIDKNDLEKKLKTKALEGLEGGESATIVAESFPQGLFVIGGGVGLAKEEVMASDGADKKGISVSFVTCAIFVIVCTKNSNKLCF